uniref:AtGLDP1 (Arabidopsis thaliana glycine decarboxylase P-protein 1) n=1 Tax=Arundo donax TaxID=35708 RepID=A0A0A9G991_ARUDO
MGTPNRCAEPTAMSAPISPGGRSVVSASRSVAMTTFTP